MPYIKNEATKDTISSHMEEVVSTIVNPGHLNYAITSLINQYYKDTGPSYVAINDIIGSLECAKAEFYRRVAVPYEEEKIKENGDVY